MKKLKNCLLSVSLLSAFLSTAEASVFSDVPEGHWASPYVQSAYESNLVAGIGNNKFSPETSITYGEFAVILCNGAYGGLYYPYYGESEHWGMKYMTMLNDQSLFKTSQETASETLLYGNQLEEYVGAPITREAVATIISNLLVRNGFDQGTLSQANAFPDVASSDISDYQKQNIANVVANGIMAGDNKGNFGAGASLNRAEASVIVKNMLEKNVLNPNTPNPDCFLLEENFSYAKTFADLSSSGRFEGDLAVLNYFSEGDQMVVVNGYSDPDYIRISYYKQGTDQLISQKNVARELPKFGGAYMGEEYNYIVFGENNMDEIATMPVVSVVKYDKNWNKIKAFSVDGLTAYTCNPFGNGNCSIAEENGELVVHTARLRFTSSDGIRHQSQLTLVLDTETMTEKTSNPSKTFQKNHVSHSYQQLVTFTENGHVTCDVGDGSPRAIVIHEMINGTYKETELFQLPMVTDYVYNYTGVKLGSMVNSSDNLLISYNCVDFNLGNRLRNPKVIVYNKTTGAIKDLTFQDCISQNRSSSFPYLVELANNKFMLLWEEFDGDSVHSFGVYTVVIDQNGNKLSEVSHYPNYNLPLSYSPVFSGEVVFWAGQKLNQQLYFQVDVPAVGFIPDNSSTTPSTSTPDSSTSTPDSSTSTPDSSTTTPDSSTSTPDSSTSTPDSSTSTPDSSTSTPDSSTSTPDSSTSTPDSSTSTPDSSTSTPDSSTSSPDSSTSTPDSSTSTPDSSTSSPDSSTSSPDSSISSRFKLTTTGLGDYYVTEVEDKGVVIPSVGYYYFYCHLDSSLPEGLELKSATLSYPGATLRSYNFADEKNLVSLCVENMPEDGSNIEIHLEFAPAYRIVLQGHGAMSMGESPQYVEDGSIVTVGWNTLNAGSFVATNSNGETIEPLTVKESSYGTGKSYSLTYQIDGSNLICTTTAP